MLFLWPLPFGSGLSFVDGTETRTYNGFGQLTEITGPGGSLSFAYRPDGLRYSKTTGSGNAAVTHIHLWDGQNIVAEAGVSGVINTRYIRGVGLVAREMDSALQYYQFNAHGDVLHRIDASGNVLKNYRYDAFGNELGAEPLDVNPFRYCGEYFDREIGTYYLRARNYDPFTGRFTTEDAKRSAEVALPSDKKAVDPLSLNLYTYCKNNPVFFTDPTGNDYVAEMYETARQATLDYWNDYWTNFGEGLKEVFRVDDFKKMSTQFPGDGSFKAEGLWGGIQGPQLNKSGLTLADLSGGIGQFGYYAEFMDIYLSGPSAGVNAGLNSKIIGAEAQGSLTSAGMDLKIPIIFTQKNLILGVEGIYGGGIAANYSPQKGRLTFGVVPGLGAFWNIGVEDKKAS